jgi:hypothetical protein
MSVRQNSQNILILKDAVGKPKRTTRDLPTKHFSYGKEIPRDPVGVQNCKLASHLCVTALFSDLGMDLRRKVSGAPNHLRQRLQKVEQNRNSLTRYNLH